MQNLKFCPKCGSQSLKWDDEKKWSCNCGFTLYNNVAAAVAVLVKCGEEILFTRRNQEPKKGKLDLAGGFTDPKENAENTCKRELYEELRLDVDVRNLKYLRSSPNIYHYKRIDYNTLDLFFEYEVAEKFEIDLEISEISEAIWIKKSDINLDEIAFDSQRIFFQEFLKF